MSVVDGRLERSARTRQAVVAAYLEIVRESGREPTAVELAERVDCSVRTIFERFGTIGGIGLAAFDDVIRQRGASPVAKPVGKSRAARIRSHAKLRAETCEAWSTLWRLVVRHAGQSEGLDEGLEAVRRLSREQLEVIYRPELGTLPKASRAALLIALEGVFDFGTWDRMRERFTVEQAVEAWVEVIDRMLPPTPATRA